MVINGSRWGPRCRRSKQTMQHHRSAEQLSNGAVITLHCPASSPLLFYPPFLIPQIRYARNINPKRQEDAQLPRTGDPFACSDAPRHEHTGEA